jgi:hypothetical protein
MGRLHFTPKEVCWLKKGFFMRTFGFFARNTIFASGQVRNYANLPKKLLLLTDLTIIINNLVVRINGYQNEALSSRGA